MIGPDRRPFRAVTDATSALELRASCWNSPAGEATVGGDWCEIVALEDDVLALTIGDVTGHGEVAATNMELLRSAIVVAVQAIRAPARILERINSLAYERNDAFIATAVVAFVDRRRRTFTFASAGHPPPLIHSGDTHAFLSGSPGDLPLGIFLQYRAAEYTVTLPPDVLLTLYTDGITEHKRDLHAGERDLARACRHAYVRRDLDAARCIAQHVFRTGRGGDDAAVLAVQSTVAPTRRSRIRTPSVYP